MTNPTLVRLLLAAGILFLATPAAESGVTVDTRRVATGLIRPVFGASPPGDLERLFIVEQRGNIRIFDLTTGTLSPGSFLNIDPLVSGGTSGGDETGCLGLAFHPEYETNGFFYVYYFASGSQTRVRRYTVSANPDVADAASGVNIISIPQPFGNHNGGTIAFSPVDGYLYIGLGDGGSFNDPQNNAQNNNSLLGKMLRIDVDGGSPYISPADNPFQGVAGARPELWSKGLRNPYRWSFDMMTGDLWIGDVGQGSREEVDFEPPLTGGRNYGWRCREGIQCTGLSGCTCPSPALTEPIHDYGHSPNNCSVIGGYVYRGCGLPGLEGTYFFADYCSNQIWSGEANGSGTDLVNFQVRTGELVPPPGGGSIGQVSGFAQDNYGEIYIFDLGGEMFKIVPTDIELQDCDGNFIVDSCESGGPVGADCNMNGEDDACEILAGTALDCNGNGIPDECDVASGVLEDCDGSGVGDICEIADGLVADCNGNDIPDSCDFLSGALTDANGDGFADECDFFILRAQDATGAVGQSGVAQFVQGTSPAEFRGFSFGMSFDPSLLNVESVDLVDTVAFGSDFVAPNFDNVAGWMTIGVVLDITPPIDTVLAPGTDLSLVRNLFAVSGTATDGDTSPLTVESSIGSPAVQPVITVDGLSEVPELVSGTFTVGGVAGLFIRGDSNADGGFDIADPVNTLAFLFSGGSALSCEDSGDANDDGALDISDSIYSLSALFSGGAQPSSPFPNCGSDPTADTLPCDSFSACP